jgi:ribosome-associated protein
VEKSARNSYLDLIPDTSRAIYVEPKGSEPLATPAVSRATRRAPASVAKLPNASKHPDAFKHPTAKETLRIVLARLEDMKAEDSVAIDLTDKPSIGDYMVVTTGRSNVHVTSIADNLVKDLKAAGITGIRVEGLRQGDWVLIDAGSVIVHIFRPEVRDFYNLEKMWSA